MFENFADYLEFCDIVYPLDEARSVYTHENLEEEIREDAEAAFQSVAGYGKRKKTKSGKLNWYNIIIPIGLHLKIQWI